MLCAVQYLLLIDQNISLQQSTDPAVRSYITTTSQSSPLTGVINFWKNNDFQIILCRCPQGLLLFK